MDAPVNPTVTPVATNPRKELPCGLKVALVLDESLSITDPELADTRAAARGFVNALQDTGASVAIIGFARSARLIPPQPSSSAYTQVTGSSITSTFNPAIANFGTFNTNSYRSGTNWQAAFDQVRTTAGGPPDLVVFMTDGDPNGINTTTSWSTALDGGVDVMTPAVASANLVKANSRVFAIGVGAALANPAAISRLTAVSGPTEFPTDTHNFLEADYTSIKEFAQLEESLKAVVAGLCGGSLIITKTDFTPDGTTVEASGWTFAATLTPPPPHVWLTPAAGSADTARLTTNGEGTVTFHWKLTSPGNARLSVVRETMKPGFDFVIASCAVDDSNGRVIRRVQRTTEPIAEGLVVPPKGHATCTVENRPHVAHLTVVKELAPENDTGRFNLLVNGIPKQLNVGNNGTTGRLPLGIGTHTVSESAGIQGDGTTTNLAHYDTSTSCVRTGTDIPFPSTPVANQSGQAGTVSLNLAANDDVTCTIRNESNQFGDLTVVKHLDPVGSGLFDLFIKNSSGTTLHSVTGVGDGGKVGPERLPFGTYVVGESAANGTNLADFDTTITCVTNDGMPVASGPGPSLSVTLANASVQCTIVNVKRHIPVAHLEVRKRLRPTDDPGLFDLRIDGVSYTPEGAGDGGTTTSLPFSPGKFTVSESLINAEEHAISLSDYSISTTCVNAAGNTVASGSSPVSVRLKDGDNVVCTITNERVKEPTDPGGGDQGGGEVAPPPCDDVDIDCGNVAGAPHLFVIKQMHAHARVGERVPITITVKNVGHVTATQVVLHETPPAGGRIVGVADHGSIQHDGTVVWHLGDLAPGKSRTVHATLLVTRTGSHTDTAVASARNADPVFDVANVRARAAVRRPPPPPPPRFTG